MPGSTRFLLLLLLAVITACSDSKAPAATSKSHKSSAILVEVARVEKQQAARTWKRTGTLVYRHVLRVHTREEGRIIRLPWFEGDRVKKGDTLAMLDNELLKAELRKARATSSMARRKVSRLERLRKTKATSEEDLIEAQTELELARAEVEILKTRMGYTTIKAPYDGIITQRLVEPGDAVVDVVVEPLEAGPVVVCQESQADRPRIVQVAQVSHEHEVAERLRHLDALIGDHADVHPVPGQGLAGHCPALGGLAFVVREDQVVATAVQVDGVTEFGHRHRRALDVPAGTSGAERRVP